MSTKNLKVKLTIDADGNITGVLPKINDQLGGVGDGANNAGQKVNGMSDALKKMRNQAAAAFSAYKLIEYTKASIRQVDAYKAMSGQVALVSDSQKEQLTIQRQLHAVATETRGDLSSMAKLYSAMSPTLKTMGKDMQGSINVIETYNKALALTSPTAAQSASATLQFSQALGSGVMRGDEFNSMMENGRGVMQAVADGIGVTLGELRALAEQGALTADVVVSALESQADAIDNKFTKIELTISSAMQVASNNTMVWLGTSKLAEQGTASLASGIIAVSNHIDDMATIVGVGLTTALLVKAKPAIWSTVLTLNSATASVAAFTAATRSATAAALAFSATPLGLVVTAVAGTMIYLALKEDEAQTAADELTESFKKLNLEISKSELTEKGKELAEYRKQLESLMARKSQNGAVDIFGVKEKELKRRIQNLLEGREAIVKLTKSKADLVNLEKEHKNIEESWFKNQLDSIDADFKFMNDRSDATRAYRNAEKKAVDDAIKQQQELRKEAEKALNSILDSALATAEAEQKAMEGAWGESQNKRYDYGVEAQWDKDNREFDKLDNQDAFLEQMSEMAKATDLYGDAWTRTGNKALDAMGSMLSVMEKVDDADTKYADKLEEARKEGLKGTQEYIDLEDARAKNSVKGSMSMLDASVAMFEEGSAAQEAAHKASLVMHAIEIGMELQKQIAAMTSATTINAANSSTALTGATASVASAGTGDPYTAPFSVLAMSAMMAGVLSQIGVAFGGASGGGSVSNVASLAQPDGSVLGSGEESESVTKVYDMMLDLETDQYAELRDISKEMKDLNSNLTGVVSSLYRTGDLSGLGDDFTASYKSDNPFEDITNQMTDVLGDIPVLGMFTSALGGLANNIGTALFGGTTKSVSDYGLNLPDFNLGDDLDLQNYTTIKKKKDGGLFGKSKTSYSNQYSDIEGESERLLNLVFDNLRNGMIEFGELVGEDVTSQVDSFAVSVGRIATSGKTSAEVQEALTNAISGQSDKLAYALFPDLVQNYAQLNEGAFETLSRLGVEKAITESLLSLTGQTTLPQDTVTLSQSLVGLAGGINELADSANSYYDAFFTEEEKQRDRLSDLTSLFSSLNLSLPESSESLRDLVSSLDLTTASGQASYVSITSATDALKNYYKAVDDAATTVLEDLLKSISISTGLVDDAYAMLQTSISNEKTALQNALNDRVSALNEEKSAISSSISALTSLKSTLDSTFHSLIGSTDGLDLMAYTTAQAQILNARSSGNFTLDDLSDALSVVSNNNAANYSASADYLRDQAITANALSDLSVMTDTQLTAEEQMVAALDVQIESAKAAYAVQIDSLSAQLAYYDASLNGAEEELSVAEAIKDLEQAMLDVLTDIRTATSDTYDTLAGSDSLIDWSEFASAFDGLATESTLKSVFNQLDINSDLYIDSIESLIGGLKGSAYSKDEISTYINEIYKDNEAGTAGQIMTSAAINTGTSSAQIASATGQSQSSIEQTMYDSMQIIDKQMAALTGNGNAATALVNAKSIFDYAAQMSLTADQVASYVPSWSVDDVNHYITGHGLATLKGFANGGYTDFSTDINQIAGVVHGGEYVAPNSQIKRYPELFSALDKERGYKNGGAVNFSLPSFSNGSIGFGKMEDLLQKLIERVDDLEEQTARTAVATENTSDKLDVLEIGIPIYDMRVTNA